MPELFTYLLKINVAIALFYFGYVFFLKKLTFYSLNRLYLIFAIVFSAVFPFLKVPPMFNKPEVLAYGFQEIEATLTFMPQVEEKQSLVWLCLVILYWGIMVFGTVKLVARLISLFRVHNRSTLDYWGGYTFRNLREEGAPFSFLGTIYLNKTLHDDQELHTILKHEHEHTQGMHSLDVLLAEIWSLFSWFNPVSRLLKKAIKVNIEFIADREVVMQGVSHQQYQYSLVHFAAQSRYIPLVNQFSFLSLKTRIIMMNKKQSSTSQLGKYVLLVPVIITSLFIFGISKAYNVNDSIELTMDDGRILENQGPVMVSPETVISSAEGEPSIKEVRIKGSEFNQTVRDSARDAVEDPLYVIDGVVQEGRNEGKGIVALSSNDIESITVLKDESATALYGDKGSHGVILVVTKKEARKGDRSREAKATVVSSATVRATEGENMKDTTDIRGVGQIQLKGVAAGVTVRGTRWTGLGDTTSLLDKSTQGPLFIIDGLRTDGKAMTKLDPNQIESVDIIKGNAKAFSIYGKKGEHGVVIIKTKK